MNAAEILHEYGRMCEARTWCKTCPLHVLDADYEKCQTILRNNVEKAAQIIEKWSKEHPEKTRLQDFLEKHPNAKAKKADCHVLVAQIWDIQKSAQEIARSAGTSQ